jgi:hypothetical protein
MRDKKGRFIKGTPPTNGFKKGVPSWNKDKHIQTNTGKTHFKKGHESNLGKHWKIEDTSNMKGSIPPWTGKIRTEFLGEKHPKWNGGFTKPHYKKLICTRDKFTCQICGLIDKEIVEVDHILPKAIAPDLTYTLTNLMCICPNCHRRKTNKDLKMISEFKNSVKKQNKRII